MVAVSSEVQGPGDGELLEAVRHGSTDAYADLYERHVGAAYSMARQVSKSPAEADDLVSETFAKVLDALRSGGGPTTAFRAYLLTSLRHTAYDRTRRERKVQLSDDVTAVPGADTSEPFSDPAVAGLERTLAAQAFSRLPERWQTVLWHLEVEGQKPADVAPLLGMNPNGVSALAYRAREGLRQAYLQVHLGQLAEAGPGVAQCRATVDRLGAWTRDGLAKRETAQVESHLDSCDRCRTLAAELADVNGGLRSVVAPLVLGVAAGGYLAASKGSAAAAGLAASGAAGSGAAGAGAGAAEAGSSLPRQIVATAASSAALVAAVALGLTAGEQPMPVAQPDPAPSPVVPQPEPAPQPQQPAPQPPAPQPAPQQPVPAPTPPPQAPAPAPPPAPAPALLNASGPTETVRLVAGGPAESMPIRVTNTGGSESEPVTASLALPPGITASVPQGRAAAGPSVQCDETDSTITCTTGQGLAPGESVDFGFVVRADDSANGGEVTGTVSAGSEVNLRLNAIPVRVNPQPTAEVDVRASEKWNTVLYSRVHLEAHNTGTTSGQAEVVATLPDGLFVVASHGCTTTPGQVRCTKNLAQGEDFERDLIVTTLPGGDDRSPVRPASFGGPPPEDAYTVDVTARLGEARDTTSVDVHLWGDGWPELPDEVAPTTSPNPTTTDPTTTPDPTTTDPTTTPAPTTTNPTTTPDPTTTDPTTTPEPTTTDPTTTPEPTTSDPTTDPPTSDDPTTTAPTESSAPTEAPTGSGDSGSLVPSG